MTGESPWGRMILWSKLLTEMSAEFFFTGAKIQPDDNNFVFGKCGAGPEPRRTSHLFLRLTGKSGIDHGDVRNFRATRAGGM